MENIDKKSILEALEAEEINAVDVEMKQEDVVYLWTKCFIPSGC